MTECYNNFYDTICLFIFTFLKKYGLFCKLHTFKWRLKLSISRTVVTTVLAKLLPLAPVNNTISERALSAMKRVKSSYLRVQLCRPTTKHSKWHIFRNSLFCICLHIRGYSFILQYRKVE